MTNPTPVRSNHRHHTTNTIVIQRRHQLQHQHQHQHQHHGRRDHNHPETNPRNPHVPRPLPRPHRRPPRRSPHRRPPRPAPPPPPPPPPPSPSPSPPNTTAHTFRILATAHNQIETTHDASAHAELLTLRRAASRLHNWRLPPDTTLYTTLEPCPMCLAASRAFRVGRVVYGATDRKLG